MHSEKQLCALIDDGKTHNLNDYLLGCINNKVKSFFRVIDKRYFKPNTFTISNVSNWISNDNLNNAQFDKYEGIVARINKRNIRKLKKYQSNGDLVCIEDGDYYMFRWKNNNNIYASCFYTQYLNKYQVVPFNNAVKLYADSCNDFLDNIKFGNDSPLLLELVSSDFLINEISKAFNKMGINPNITFEQVKYDIDLKRDWECKEKHPFELFHKIDNKIFKNQCEKRLLCEINTKENELNNYYPLQIENSELCFSINPISNQKSDLTFYYIYQFFDKDEATRRFRNYKK